jgi:hypothetical protein
MTAPHFGRQLSMPLDETPDALLHAARLAELRRQIEADTYETPGRLEAALDAMLDLGVLKFRGGEAATAGD